MVKKTRSPEIHFYEFNIDLWFMSETRLRCSLAAKGAYLELLHYCYKHGSVPADAIGMAAICGCTPSEVEDLLPSFRNKFLVSKNDSSRLTNSHADIFRRNYFLYLKKQSQNGRGKGKKKTTDKPNDNSRLPNGGLTVAERSPNQDETKRNETNEANTKRERDDTNEVLKADDPPPAAVVIPFERKQEPTKATIAEWPLTADAVRLFFMMADDLIILRIVFESVKADREVTDSQIAEAVIGVHSTSQQSPALFLTTVPKWIAAKSRALTQARDGPTGERRLSATEDRQRRLEAKYQAEERQQ